jgi:regulator of sigma E protease
VVLVHEIGHFSTARFFRVKVEEFGFGIPPRAKTLFKDKK